jgi:hypothetical protein
VSEWGNLAFGNRCYSVLSKVGTCERTEGTETSKYLEENKSKEIALVAASERATGQTSMLACWGCRTDIKGKLVRERSGKVDHRG